MDTDPAASTPGSAPGVTPAHAARLRAGERLGTRYEIVGILGEGGMGTVYRAIDRELGRDVALKVIRPDMASRPEVLERFKREILLASRVTHRNVLRIHDLGEAGPLRFISMSFVEGTNLKELLRREGPLPLERALPLLRQITEALGAAHEAGVVHRDLKPQNILIDKAGTPYIADFGISRSIEAGSTMTETGAILGTVDYMSPEQARGETPDHRGDLYALGLILYEMLTGTLPFRSDNPLSVMMKRVHEDAPPMRRSQRRLPAWIDAIAARALQRNPKDRYQSAGALLRDLDRRRAGISWHRLARPRPLAALVVAVVVAALGLWAVRHPRPRAGPPGPTTSLVVLPFLNATGDSRYDWVRAALPDLVRAGLRQARGLRMVDTDRLNEILEGLNVAEGTEPRQDTLLRVATLSGADSLLSASVLKAGDRFRIEATLTHAGPSTLSPGRSIRVEGNGAAALFGMIDDLTRRVRATLGVSRGLLERERDVSTLSTQSVEALRLYGEGLSLSRAGRPLDAAGRLEEALVQDPQFAMARALLAETYRRLGRDAQARQEADRAVRSLGATSPYEAARIRAVAARLSGDGEAALKAYKGLAEVAPNDAATFLELAAVQEEQGDLAGARESLRRVIALDPGHPAAHFTLGRVRFKEGDPGDALQEFNTALSLYVKAGNDEGRATVLNGLGNAYKVLGQPDEALRYYRESLAIRRRIGDRHGVDVALNNIAMLLYAQGRYDDAVSALNEAIAIGRETGAGASLAVTYQNLGDVQQGAGRPEAALDAYQEGLRIVRSAGDDADLGRALDNVGFINTVLGHYLEAYFFLKDALEKQRATGDKNEVVRALIDIGFVEQVQGRYDEALKYELEGLSLAREVGNKAAATVLLLNLSNIHEDQGDYGAALDLLGEACKAADELADRTMVATCRTYRASVRIALGDLEGGSADLEEALKLARDLDNRLLEAEALGTRGILLLERRRPREAATVLSQAAATARAMQDRRLMERSRLLLAEARGDAAGLQAVVRDSGKLGLLPLRARGELALAQIGLTRGRADEALAHARAAIDDAAALHQQDLLFQARHVATTCLRRGGRTAEARDQARQALDALEAVRRGLAPADRGAFLHRSQIVAFAGEAEGLFQGADDRDLRDRMRALLSPGEATEAASPAPARAPTDSH